MYSQNCIVIVCSQNLFGVLVGIISHQVNKQICEMELFLDKNGTNVQRRKMYIGFPVHNMKSHLKFDWQNDDPSIQDQIGKKYKLDQEKKQLKKKYTELVDKKMYNRYVELNDDNHELPTKNAQNDILTKQVQNFNQSKMISANRTPQNIPNEGNNNLPNRQQFSRSFDNSPNLLNYSPIQSSRAINNRDYSVEYPPKESRTKQMAYQLNKSYNPQNYYTINPQSDRYDKLYSKSPNYELGSAPSKFVQKMYTGTAVSDYPFRNVKPDELQYHLREKTKADHKKAVKVTLNMFDYYTKN